MVGVDTYVSVEGGAFDAADAVSFAGEGGGGVGEQGIAVGASPTRVGCERI